MTLIKVTIGGESHLYTADAYAELRLQFSTGDFHVHKAEIVSVVDPHPDSYIDLDLLINQINGEV